MKLLFNQTSSKIDCHSLISRFILHKFPITRIKFVIQLLEAFVSQEKVAADEDLGFHELDEAFAVDYWIDGGDEHGWPPENPNFETRLSFLLKIEFLEIVNDSQVINVLATTGEVSVAPTGGR